MSTTPVMTDVFNFMQLRAPYSPTVTALRKNYIRDDLVELVGEKPARIDADLQSGESPSMIGRLVYDRVFWGDVLWKEYKNKSHIEINNMIIEAVIAFLLTPYIPPPNLPKRRTISIQNEKPMSIFELEKRAYIRDGNVYYLLPERLEQIEGLNLFPEILRAFEVMEAAQANFDLSKLVQDLQTVFGGTPLAEVVFSNGVYSDDFRSAKRTLFDTLYMLYILRRRTSVNLEYVIEGLRTLHVLEALAIDSLIGTFPPENPSGSWESPDESQEQAFAVDMRRIPGSSIKQEERNLLKELFPEILTWNDSEFPDGLPLINSESDFNAYFSATPVIHPMFSALSWYREPFNNLRPIGIGDLKVVKQWLIAYLPGEVSYIENVLKGEIRDRTHRRLEKTQEVFSLLSEATEEALKDTQTTDRYELKREAENILKTEIGVGANASVTAGYSGGGYSITGSVGANFSYKKDKSEQNKTSGTFWHETINKAVSRVQKRTLEQRSITKLFETEETNKHGFDNVQGEQHISGIYRWVDKQYKAQLYNYGKRLMFEFIIPEPAAFFVESRLREFIATVDVPQPPRKQEEKVVELPFRLRSGKTIGEAKDIKDESIFLELSQAYDLSEFSYPKPKKRVDFLNSASGNNYFEEKSLPNDKWHLKTYNFQAGVKGYYINRLGVIGTLKFWTSGESGARKQNIIEISIGGNRYRHEDNSQEQWDWTTEFTEWEWQYPPETNQNNPFESDEIRFSLGFQDGNWCKLSLFAEVTFSDKAMESWQTNVFNRVFSIEQQKVDAINQEQQLTYDAAMTTYRNRLDEIKAQAINELLKGQSEAFNREIILTELKKHCITSLAKEWDADLTDDLFPTMEPVVDPKPDTFKYRKFVIDEKLETEKPEATLELRLISGKFDYPAINLSKGKEKGRYVQFLEQAFEWNQLTYIFYPYFWASRPKWIDMMNRKDNSDPYMTAFLQAGSTRVLLAVTPAYDHAVLHFLATREPWEGGPTPALWDPFFIPLYEEVRKQQDDLYNAVPEGEPWEFTLPTSLVYLQDSTSQLPTFPDPPNP